MHMKLFNSKGLPLLAMSLDNRSDNWLNLSAIARYLDVPRSTFLQRVNDYGWESALAHYEQQRKTKLKH